MLWFTFSNPPPKYEVKIKTPRPMSEQTNLKMFNQGNYTMSSLKNLKYRIVSFLARILSDLLV
jgi:hypothetical protein